MTVLKINKLNLDKITPEEFDKLVNTKMKAYYEKHFQNNKNIEQEVYKLSKHFYLDMWNAYICLSFLVYCLGNLRISDTYKKEFTQQEKDNIDFYFDNFDISFSYYEAIMDKLLKVAEKLNIKLNQFTP